MFPKATLATFFLKLEKMYMQEVVKIQFTQVLVMQSYPNMLKWISNVLTCEIILFNNVLAARCWCYLYRQLLWQYLELSTICFYKWLASFRCCVLQMTSTGGQSLSLSSNVPLLNYQPGLYQQATINIPGLPQQGVPLQTRPTQLCAQTEPFQPTLIVCPPTIQGENAEYILFRQRVDAQWK